MRSLAAPSLRDARALGTIVMQPNTLCNLDCLYCYLPHRDQQRLMSTAVAKRAAANINAAIDPAVTINLIWHAGEPLTTPRQHFRNLLEPFEVLRKHGRISHGLQTNATLIDQAWCDLFQCYEIGIGVSLDGPAELNDARSTRNGRSSYQQTLAGIRLLQRNQIPFRVICVVTADTVHRAPELLTYFSALGCTSVGFNIEEKETADDTRTPITQEQATAFWQDILLLRPKTLEVREINALTTYIAAARAGQPTQTGVDPIPTVGWDGSVVVLSPELLGVPSTKHADFVVGNVLSRQLTEIVRDAQTAPYVRESLRTIGECARRCDFYEFCGGGEAANRFFEHGGFTRRETQFCRNTKQALVNAAYMCLNRDMGNGRETGADQ